jgi:hypothetical protein
MHIHACMSHSHDTETIHRVRKEQHSPARAFGLVHREDSLYGSRNVIIIVLKGSIDAPFPTTRTSRAGPVERRRA